MIAEKEENGSGSGNSAGGGGGEAGPDGGEARLNGAGLVRSRNWRGKAAERKSDKEKLARRAAVCDLYARAHNSDPHDTTAADYGRFLLAGWISGTRQRRC